MTRRQIHAYGLTALLLLIIALGVALAMLGHAMMAGGPQWSAGILAGGLVVLTIVVMVVMGVGFALVGDEVERRRSHRAAARYAARHHATPTRR